MDLNETARWVEDLKTGATLADRLLAAWPAPLIEGFIAGGSPMVCGTVIVLTDAERAYITERHAAGWAPRP